jgi:5'-3' exonuclease
MGIRYLNKFLRNNCTESIRCVTMNDLRNKKIVIDISIYLYKYEAENTLLENIYLMLSIFKYYNIIPIFVFDGKPPKEKISLLKKRKEDKNMAEQEYNKLKSLLRETNDEDDKQELISTMDILKKQFIYISKDKIDKVKQLIRAYGASYYDAPGEADVLCAMLVIKKKVWACLSEDMDLFVYGCNRVLRYLSLMNHNVVLYHMKGILDELQMNHSDFKQICILSGTDYNYSTGDNINLYKTLKLFQRFKNNNNLLVNTDICFYNWLLEHTNYINDIELLNKIITMFDIKTYDSYLNNFKNIKILNGPLLENEIRKIMKQEGFIFITNM